VILTDPNTLLSYIPVSERGKDKPVTFWFKPFTVGEYLKYKDQLVTRVRDDVVNSDKKVEEKDVEVLNDSQVKNQLFADKVIKITNVEWPDKLGEFAELTNREDIIKFRDWMPPMTAMEVIVAIQNTREIEKDVKKK